MANALVVVAALVIAMRLAHIIGAINLPAWTGSKPRLVGLAVSLACIGGGVAVCLLNKSSTAAAPLLIVGLAGYSLTDRRRW